MDTVTAPSGLWAHYATAGSPDQEPKTLALPIVAVTACHGGPAWVLDPAGRVQLMNEIGGGGRGGYAFMGVRDALEDVMDAINGLAPA